MSELARWSEWLPADIAGVFAQAELIFSPSQVDQALDRLAVAMTAHLQAQRPVLLTVMQGGLYFAGALARRFAFPAEFDYVHVSRYRDRTSGSELRWHTEPTLSLNGRTVVLLDDILDEGVTLAALGEWCQDQGAHAVQLAVLIARQREQAACHADFAASRVGQGFLVGCGMDYKGYGRNLSGIYTLPSFA